MSGATHRRTYSRPLQLLVNRVDDAANVSDDAHFHDLMLAHEMCFKYVTAILVAVLDSSTRQAFEHALVRDSGLWRWSQAGVEIATGQASDCLAPPGEACQQASASLNHMVAEFSQKFPLADATPWQARALNGFLDAAGALGIDLQAGTKAGMAFWLRSFHALRNDAKGHGAYLPAQRAAAAGPLARSLDAFLEGASILQLPLAYVSIQPSGRRTTQWLGGAVSDRLPSIAQCDEGLHVLHDDQLFPLRLVFTDRQLRDFFLPNGKWKDEGTFEALSYISGTKQRMPGGPWTGDRPLLVKSVTAGRDMLNDGGSNLPPRPAYYVSRPELEAKLAKRLNNRSNHVVTLTGRGGIGKTTLALQVLHEEIDEDRFAARLWFSARDVDLEDDGHYHAPKPVAKQVESLHDVAASFCRLLDEPVVERPGVDDPCIEQMTRLLSDKNHLVPLLLVFDNFETVDDPLSLFEWLEEHVQVPHKALITTRIEDFEGDYAIDVGGMAPQEFDELVSTTSERLGIEALITSDYSDELFQETGGHPYVARVVLGEIERTRRLMKPSHLMAARDQILDALFQEIYESLSLDQRRVYLTLGKWRSVVPLVALETTLLRPGNLRRLDVTAAVEVLERRSMIELLKHDGQVFINLPMVAATFARRRLSAASMDLELLDAIEEDARFLQQFGPMTPEDVDRDGLGPRVRRFVGLMSVNADEHRALTQDESAALTYLGKAHTASLRDIAHVFEQVQDFNSAISCLKRLCDADKSDWIAWRELARMYYAKQDTRSAVQTLVQGSMFAGKDFNDVSHAADRFIAALKDDPQVFDLQTRKTYAGRLLDVMLTRLAEATGGDIARAAWLLVHSQDREGARKLYKDGLLRFPSDPYLLRLRARFG